MIIKQTINKAVAIYMVAKAIVAYKGSEQFQQALLFANDGKQEQDKRKAVDSVLVVPEYRVSDGEDEVICPEQAITTIRCNISEEPLVALVVDDTVTGGTFYQFLYGCDRAEILTDQGDILEVVNAKANC